jgi:hypothetical protein
MRPTRAMPVLAAVLAALAAGCGGPQGAPVPECPPAAMIGLESVAADPVDGAEEMIPINCWRLERGGRLRRVAVVFTLPGAAGDAGCQRLARVGLVESAEAVAITLSVARVSAPCPSAPEQRVTTVELQAPLDGRRVLDGGRAP